MPSIPRSCTATLPRCDNPSVSLILSANMHALILLLIIALRASVTTACHSFKDTNITVVSQSGDKYHTVISGCLERKVLDSETAVTEIYVEKQVVPKLERDTIKHLHKLTVFSVSQCRVEVVEVDLFRNVPRLRKVRIIRNELREVPEGVFSTLERLEVLDLRGNEITKIESGAFGNSSTLKEVVVGYNHLELWSAEWFHKSPNVQVIDFQHNKIKVVPRRAFSDLQKLQKICFDYNEVEVIHPEAFAGITHLRFLGLRHNRLKELNPRSFSSGLVVEKMAIDANYLNYLPKRLLAGLEVKEMILSGNPWKCPCLDEIHHWLFEANGTETTPGFCKGRDIPVCFSPSTFSHTCRETIDDEVTEDYLGKLKAMSPPLKEYCARLDRVKRQVI